MGVSWLAAGLAFLVFECMPLCRNGKRLETVSRLTLLSYFIFRQRLDNKEPIIFILSSTVERLPITLQEASERGHS